jgi:hypothetical protein
VEENKMIDIRIERTTAPKAKPELGEMNARALQMGYDYEG